MRSGRLALCLLLIPFVPAANASEAPPILVSEWQVVGPFETGSREGFVHHLAGSDGRVPRELPRDRTWPSVLADGGRVGWKTVTADRDASGAVTGRTTLKLEGVDWEARESEWGAAALFNTAYASGSFVLAEPARLLLEASRCLVVLNGVPIAGDPYGQGIAQCVVRGRTGTNDLLVVTSGYGGERAFELKLSPMPAADVARIVEKDLLVPDLIAGLAGASVAGVPVISGSDDWLSDLSIEFAGALRGSARVDGALAPLAALKVPVPVEWSAVERPAGDQPMLPFTVRLRQGLRILATAEGKVAVRMGDEARVETFVSRIDGSAQKLGLLPAGGAAGPKALILSLHGAGVDCLGQVRSYSRKDWAHVVAPTNRRTFGFDWHDWGALDAEEVLREATSRLDIDADRVHVSGHSMGGHGTWAFAVSHAGVLASAAPSAGWNGYDSYLPTTLRRSVNFAPPELSAMYVRGIASGRASTLLENLRFLPTFVLHGGADDNVPATHGRLLAAEMERLGADVTYREVPGMGHWWDADKARPGADCVDSAELEAFWKSRVRRQWPPRVVLATADLDVASTSHWLRIEQQQRIAEIARVDAEFVEAKAPEPARIVVTTRNVAALSLHLGPRLVPEGPARLEIDGQSIPIRLARDRELVRCVRRFPSAGWTASVGPWLEPAVAPAPGPGGLRKALFQPFTLIVGTRGLPERNERMLDLARSIALAWWVRANGTCPIVKDVDVTDELRASRNLVLLGGPDVNGEAKRIAKDLSVSATSGGVLLAGRRVASDELASVHWQPSPGHPARRLLVFQATTASADTLLASFNPVASDVGFPDFIVATPAMRLRSWGGFAAAGWWDPRFGFDPRNTWVDAELR